MMTRKPTHGGGDFLHAEAYELEELRSAVFQGSDRLPRPLALGLLARKAYPEKTDDFARLLMNDDEPPGLRKVAAHELARMDAPEATTLLREALSVRDPLVKQDVIAALARVGGDEELKAVRGFRDRKTGDVARSAQWTSQLLTYLTGARGNGVPMPPRRTWRPADERRAQPVEVAKARGKRLEAALDGARQAIPAAGLSPEGGLALTCGDREMVLLLREGISQGGAQALRDSRTVAAVITERHTLEDESWEIRFLVLTEPSDDETALRVLVCTPRGVVRFVGTLALKGDTPGAFELVGVDGPGAIPLLADGVLDEGVVRFDRLLAEQRTRPGSGRGVRKR